MHDTYLLTYFRKISQHLTKLCFVYGRWLWLTALLHITAYNVKECGGKKTRYISVKNYENCNIIFYSFMVATWNCY